MLVRKPTLYPCDKTPPFLTINKKHFILTKIKLNKAACKLTKNNALDLYSGEDEVVILKFI